MKKIVKMLAVVFVCTITLMVPSAKSLKEQTLNGIDGGALIVKYDTEAQFHTSIYPTYMNESVIRVENTIQRRNILGNWQNRVQNRFDVTTTKRSYIINAKLSGTADTRSIWTNVTSGTRVIADLYINNGYDYDINITPNYIN